MSSHDENLAFKQKLIDKYGTNGIRVYNCAYHGFYSLINADNMPVKKAIAYSNPKAFKYIRNCGKVCQKIMNEIRDEYISESNDPHQKKVAKLIEDIENLADVGAKYDVFNETMLDLYWNHGVEDIFDFIEKAPRKILEMTKAYEIIVLKKIYGQVLSQVAGSMKDPVTLVICPEDARNKMIYVLPMLERTNAYQTVDALCKVNNWRNSKSGEISNSGIILALTREKEDKKNA